MADFLKKYLLPLKQDILLFTVLALPGVLAFIVGLNQFGAWGGISLTLGVLIKFINEFFVVAVIFYFFHFLGIKRAWALALVIFLYYITLCADLAILLYFKERFVSKYLMTLGGANYKFMTDVRLLSLLAVLYSLPYFAIKKLWVKTSFKQSTKKLAATAVLLLFISCISPFRYIASEQAFYTNLLMDTPLVNLLTEFISGKPKQKIVQHLPYNLEEIAHNYNLFNPTNFKNQNTYKKIILLTTEALSNKFISTFNPNVPEEASSIYDGLIYFYPYASLKPVTLSTLYGLSVIFSGHPNAELSFKNSYPLSFVRKLKENGFRTVFIRGANEKYMNEDKIFQSAGFEEIYGAAALSKDPKYKPYIAWWGLTDRKLFDFTVDYLKKHKNEKLFINILNVDTHVPTGRTDYLGQEYQAVSSDNRKIEALYKKPTMPRAFARHNEDLGLFLQKLKDENLLDDETLLIITADHPFFANMEGKVFTQNTSALINEVPMIFISKKPILEPIADDIFKSQQDIAPTVLGLAGLEIPHGMFGRSIFDNTALRTVFNIKDGYVKIDNTDGQMIIPFNSKEQKNKDLLAFLNTAFVEGGK